MMNEEEELSQSDELYEAWAPLVELRIGSPMYTPDSQKLYPVYLHHEDKKALAKYVTPLTAAGIGLSLIDIFRHLPHNEVS